MKKKHNVHTLAASIIGDLLDSITDSYKGGSEDGKVLPCNTADTEKIIDVPDDDTISEYERIRNARVAAIEAEFQKLYPSFEQDVLGLKVPKPSTKRRQKREVSKPSVLRRSSRFLGQEDSDPEIIEKEGDENLVGSVPCVGEVSGAGDERVAKTDEVDEGTTVAGDGVDETEGSNRTEKEVMEAGEVVEVDNGDTEGGIDCASLGKHGCQPCGMNFRYIKNWKFRG